MNGTDRAGGGARLAFAAFVVAIVCLLSLAVVYAVGGQPQAEGALLGVGLLALGAGLVFWAHWLMPRGPFEQERHPLAGSEDELTAFEDTLEHPEGVSRRRLLVGGLLGALGALGVALVFPIRSLGPNPGSTLLRTPWRRGTRAITEDGRPVRASEVPLDGLVTIFPAGHPNSADGQVVLVRVRPERLQLSAARADWAPDGLVAYSKVCTHAGCPVGLFEPSTAQLLCPCHQSAFDVLDGAEPVFGPAARALPQLPIAIDEEGYVIAQSDFHEPIGPSFWNRR
ncbi:MAG TPA: Rieske (2Fe-2S) protein [Acidimicrobiia bacterium]